MLGIVASRNGHSRNGRVRNGRSRIGRSRIGTSTGQAYKCLELVRILPSWEQKLPGFLVWIETLVGLRNIFIFWLVAT